MLDEEHKDESIYDCAGEDRSTTALVLVLVPLAVLIIIIILSIVLNVMRGRVLTGNETYAATSDTVWKLRALFAVPGLLLNILGAITAKMHNMSKTFVLAIIEIIIAVLFIFNFFYIATHF